MRTKTPLITTILVFTAIAVAAIFWFDIFFTPDYWEQNISNIGSSSSPRAIDLTGDGVKDIVMGGGGAEFATTEYGAFALDGKNGMLLWSVPARNQIFGSPVFQDINSDAIPDVFIAGRSAILYAINGKSGERIWEFMPDTDSLDIVNDRNILNFYNLQFIPDQDGDGLKDILTAYGGYIKAAPNDPDRPAGSLMVISSQDGKTLSKVNIPDGRETYMSPLIYDFEGDGTLSVLFGSGGETFNGHLYKVSLKDVINGNISEAKELADGNGKGFIAPPVLADITGDDIKDIIVNSVNGTVFGIDGSTEEILWESSLGDEFEGYTTPSPGNFNNDNITDFFVSYGHGVWPNIDFAYQVIINGSDGSVISADTAGTFQYASPLTFDFNEDGHDEAVVVINKKTDQSTGGSTSVEIFINEMLVFDPHNENQYRIDEQKTGSNLGSTPLLTDLDGDGYLDIIYSYMDDPFYFYSFKSLKVERIETKIEVEQPVRWGVYMGPEYDGVYK